MAEPQPSSGAAETRTPRTQPHGSPDGLWPEGEALNADAPAREHRPADADSCVLLAPPSGGEWLGQDHRRLERYPVQASRPIAARLLDSAGQPEGRWFLTDILDISRGGLCLLVSGPMPLAGGQQLQLDVRCHPDFGQLRLEVEVRWCRSSFSFTTLGLAFLQPRQRVPRLEVERRTVRRDPNTEAWAQE